MTRIFVSLLLSTVPVFTCHAVGDASMKNFEKQIDVASVGKVRLSYKFTGEPVVAPAHLEIWVKCRGAKAEKLVERVSMCDLKNYAYEAEVKLLTLSYVFGRVEKGSGSAHCDGSDQREIKLSRICRN